MYTIFIDQPWSQHMDESHLCRVCRRRTSETFLRHPVLESIKPLAVQLSVFILFCTPRSPPSDSPGEIFVHTNYFNFKRFITILNFFAMKAFMINMLFFSSLLATSFAYPIYGLNEFAATNALASMNPVAANIRELSE